MEETWDRQRRRTAVDLGEIRALLEPVGISLARVEPFGEGKANCSLMAETVDGGRFVLRLRERSPETLNVEIAVLRYVRSGAPAPAVVATGEGWILLEFIPGRTLQTAAAEGAVDEILASARAMGATLAQIAEMRFDDAGFLNGQLEVVDPWPSIVGGLGEFLEACLARPLANERVGPGLLASVAKVWANANPDLEALTTRPNLTHGDFKPSNLLIDRGNLSGVIDWEFAHAGTWLLDAGQLLRHRAELPPAFGAEITACMRGTGLEVPEDWPRWACIVDLVNLVDFIGRSRCSRATSKHIVRLIEANLREFS